MEYLYISIGLLFVGAILYKITDYPRIIYWGYSAWWAGWAFLVSWIISFVFEIEVSKLLIFSVIAALMAVYYGVKALIKRIKNDKYYLS